MVHNNGASSNDDCETIAVRIRWVSDNRMWPNIPKTTLLFSSKKIYYTIGDLEEKHDMIEYQTRAIEKITTYPGYRNSQ